MQATIATTPETEAALDARVLDIIENTLLDRPYNATMTDDLVLGIQEYMKDSSNNQKSTLALLADNAKLRGVFKLVQQIKNTPEFLSLVAEYTPDEIPAPTPKPSVVAVGTTAKDVVAWVETVTDDPEAIAAAKKAVAAPAKPTKGKPGKKSSGSSGQNLAQQAPKKGKVTPKLQMPTIVSVAQLEAMSRKELMEAVKAINSNNPTGVRANAASVTLKEAICSNLMGLDYVAPAKPAKVAKTPKAKKEKVVEIIDLPEGLCWDEVKDMKYRALQQLGKAFRSQGYQMPRLNSKGDTIREAIAEAMRKMGHDVAKATVTPAPGIKELHLPNLAAALESRRLQQMELAVA